MKRPIDPNLNKQSSDELFDIIGTDETPKSESPRNTDMSETNAENAFKSDESAQKYLSASPAEKETFEISETQAHHHHHHHHHSSQSEHSHHSDSSHSHHSSSSHSHHASHSHKHSKKKKKSKLSTSAKIGISALSVFLAIVLAIVGILAYFEINGKNSLTDTGDNTDYRETIEYNGETYVYNENIVSIVFIGVDKRELGLDDGVVGTAGQADADIVLTIDTETGKTTAIAIPRDTMVDIDLYSESGIFLRSENLQLCLSYAYGNGTDTSAQNVITSVSRILYDVPITKYFALDLDGIAPINDAIGGVTVESLYDFTDLGIKKGDTIHLEGDMTETYVRQRDMDTVNASLNRTQRQVQYIKAFAAQVVPAVTKDFNVLTKLYNTASDYSTTNLSLSNVTYLASLALSKGITDFETKTIEGEMKASEKEDYENYVYAEFYPDSDKLMQLVLDTFYTKQ